MADATKERNQKYNARNVSPETEEPIILSNTSHTHFTILPFVQRAVNQSTSGLLGFKSIPVILNFNNLHLTLILQDVFGVGRWDGDHGQLLLVLHKAAMLHNCSWFSEEHRSLTLFTCGKMKSYVDWSHTMAGLCFHSWTASFESPGPKQFRISCDTENTGYFTDGKFKGRSFYIKTNI